MQAGRCDNTISVFIYINCDDGSIADGEREIALFAEGQEQIFAQTPIEERADTFVDADHLEVGKFTSLREWRLGGGD